MSSDMSFEVPMSLYTGAGSKKEQEKILANEKIKVSSAKMQENATNSALFVISKGLSLPGQHNYSPKEVERLIPMKAWNEIEDAIWMFSTGGKRSVDELDKEVEEFHEDE